MKVLDCMRLPLDGQHLIEASAGTGKTWTICTLVLRLLLGHSDGRTGVAPRGIAEILIVTFTRAATEELRGRIGARLRLAERAFADNKVPEDDTALAELLAASVDRAADRARLAQALNDLDLASIFTIHGFANRMLERHAFESRASFAAELADDDRETVREAVLDFWRERVYPLAIDAAVAVLDGQDADRFAKQVAGLLNRQELAFDGVPEPDWQTLVDAIAAEAAAIHAWWRDNRDVAVAMLSAIALKSDGRAALARAIAELDAEPAHRAGFDRKTLDGIDPAYLATELMKGRGKNAAAPSLPDSPLFTLAERLRDSQDALRRRLLHDAVVDVRARLHAAKAASGRLGYEDLLRLLDEGLNGPLGDRLAEAIRQQYPVALIDEFQDTDVLQWRVFGRIHGHASCALYLVGDPKQAIYAFRGADVYAYLQASRAMPSRHTMDTNQRSVGTLLAALNAFYGLRRDGDAFAAGGLMAYVDVKGAGRAERKPLLLRGAPAAPLQVLRLDATAPLSTTAYRERIAAASAAHLAAQLQSAARRELTLDGKPLRPGDVACLVRGWPDAEALEKELRRRDIPCVYRGRESVYGRPVARDVLLLLDAVLYPGSERHLRAALGSALFGHSVSELDALLNVESELLRQQERFTVHADLLRRNGPQAVLRQILLENGVPARLLARPGGERDLTDCLHLLELLQQERGALDSDTALRARLAEHISDPDPDSESQVLRLESDAGRVQVVTLHAAKGLEYPVVYLPFMAALRETDVPLYHDGDTWRLHYDLGASDAALARAKHERLAEDLRLLYVGLTRAAHCCVLGIADTRHGRGNASDLHLTALGHLLDLREGDDVDAAIARLGTLPHTCLLQADASVQPVAMPAEPTPALAAREFHARVERDWRATSYSALTRVSNTRAERVFRQPELLGDRGIAAPEASGIFAFPAGAAHGSFLHGLLEQIDFARGARAPGTRDWLLRALARNGYDAGLLPALVDMLDDVLGCDLDGAGLRLAALPARDRVPELGFELPLAGLDAARLNALIDPDRRLPPLEFPRLQGMLSGFIDLVFSHQGRYYVADFKSNLLGTRLQDYAPERLDAAMVEHRYDVQYLFYTVALVRLLRLRLGAAFDYDTHVGGVYYLYLRGMRRDGGNAHGVWFRRPPEPLITALDALFAGVRADVA